MENKRYKIKLEVLTPLCVGAGNDNDWVEGIDFVCDRNRVYILDINKLTEYVEAKALTNLFLSPDRRSILAQLGNNIQNVSRYVFDKPAAFSPTIKSFLRTQLHDKPIVAGSSLKGAIDSALLWNFLFDEDDKLKQTYKQGSNNRLNSELFDKNEKDFRRFLKISDIELDSTILVNSKLFNLRSVMRNEWEGGWKHGNANTTDNFSPKGFNTWYECAEPGANGIGYIKIDANGFYRLQHTKFSTIKREIVDGGIENLFKVINDHTMEYLYKELDFFKKYEADKTDEIIRNINTLLDKFPDKNNSYCILKMSAGSGFHSITGDWQYDDYDKTGVWETGRNRGKKKYKSRKTCTYQGKQQLMGFVKLSCME